MNNEKKLTKEMAELIREIDKQINVIEKKAVQDMIDRLNASTIKD